MFWCGERQEGLECQRFLVNSHNRFGEQRACGSVFRTFLVNLVTGLLLRAGLNPFIRVFARSPASWVFGCMTADWN